MNVLLAPTTPRSAAADITVLGEDIAAQGGGSMLGGAL